MNAPTHTLGYSSILGILYVQYTDSILHIYMHTLYAAGYSSILGSIQIVYCTYYMHTLYETGYSSILPACMKLLALLNVQTHACNGGIGIINTPR